MSATREEITRLAFAKYLLSVANRHLLTPEPLASVGLLLLHDATEHLLVISAYKVGADPRKTDFMGYWKLLEEHDILLPDKGQMSAFNEARVALKHRGVQPSRSQSQEFYNRVSSFFETVVPMVFGTNLAAVNLTAFVRNDEVRESLEIATTALDEGRFTDAVTNAAYAFEDIQRSSPLKIHHERDTFLFDLRAPHIRRDEFSMDDEAHRFFEAVSRSIKALQESVFILSLGINHSRLPKFMSIAPQVATFVGGGRKAFDRRSDKTIPHTREDADFCISFAIDAAFQAQEHLPL